MSTSIDREQLKEVLVRREADPDLDIAIQRAKALEIEVLGREQFFKLRRNWSKAITRWITTFVCFHILLTFLIGAGVLNFEKYQWLVPLIVVENFLQIVGMGYVVVKFLYAGAPGDPPPVSSTAQTTPPTINHDG